MKFKHQQNTVFIVSLIGLAVFSGCSPQQNSNAQAAFQNVEQGTGKVLEGGNRLISHGVYEADKMWETEDEQRKAEEAKARK